MAHVSHPVSPALSDATPWDFWALLKPRVMSLSIFTAAVGMILAPGHVHFGLGVVALFAIAMGAGGAGALNMWWDADMDAHMKRTAARPLPAGRLEASDALMFGLTLSLLGCLLLGLATNFYAAGWLAFTIFFYVVIYTILLKRYTVQNIVIGGAAGALPPVVGWAAVSPHPDLFPLFLFLIIFLWTPPHFWALAILTREDYARAGVPMLPGVQGVPATCRQILLYTILMVLASLGPTFLGDVGLFYTILALGLGLFFIWRAWALMQMQTPACARHLFFYSILYLFVLYLAFIVDHFLRGGVL